jgi:hypothetical protein
VYEVAKLYGCVITLSITYYLILHVMEDARSLICCLPDKISAVRFM